LEGEIPPIPFCSEKAIDAFWSNRFFRRDKMGDKERTKEQLLDELKQLRQQIGENKSAVMRERSIAEKWRRSEKRYHTVYNIAPLAFLTWDKDCRVTGWNDQAKKLFGWSEEDVLGRSFFDFLVPESERAVVEEVVKELRKGALPSYAVNQNLTKGGENVLCEWNNEMLYDAEGNVTEVISLALDITEKKRIEDALRNTNADLEQEVAEHEHTEEELRNALKEIEALQEQLQADYTYLREEIKLEHNFNEIIGVSNALKYVLFKIEQIASIDTTVLVLGETGTGKELVARAIHNMSPRKNRPLVKVDCATLPSNLIESELFGHEKGSFTGSQERTIGRFELAHGSTIFLDEIGELPLALQSKLLRVIQDGEFERIGSSSPVKVDVRIIAATNRNLENEIRKGNFRQDLWYRLNVFPITVPPLRQRVEDIPLLVNAFVNKFSKKIGKTIEKVTKDNMNILKHCSWPGNVRELQNVIERAVINTKGSILCLTDKLEVPLDVESETNRKKSLKLVEHDCILNVLQETKWKIEGKNGAAVILGLNPSTLRSRMRNLGIRRK
jgi:chemotaxis protein methyltransferase CheR